MEDMKIPLQPENTGSMVNPKLRKYTILVEETDDGGAILVCGNIQNPGDKRTAVVAGDKESASFQRKVQRTIIGWMREIFTAPPRKGSKAAADIEAAESNDPE